MVDTHELFSLLDGWLRDVFLPQLSEGVWFVVASRHPPDPAWRADPGWQPLLRVLPLHTLRREEGRDHRVQRNVPEEELQVVLDSRKKGPIDHCDRSERNS